MSSHLNYVSFAAHSLVLASNVTTTTKAPAAKSNPLLSYGILIFFGLAIYLLVLRPRQRTRQRQAQNKQASIGDEVMLASGIIGRVTSLEGDRATVEIAPEIEIEVVSRSIAQVLVPAMQDDWESDPDSLSEDPGAVHPADEDADDENSEYADDEDAEDHDGDDDGPAGDHDVAAAGPAVTDHTHDTLGAGQLSDASHPDSTTEQGRTP
ncbi:MAG TPA: preprotein translocase subunit YajC [Acidimicrobiales bacterium]|nr:preprotein translocase subunit YajC [Acidimicrobiales bacterium]